MGVINVVLLLKDFYDLKQIKEDVIWLSKNVNVNEVVVLCIVVVEYQLCVYSYFIGFFLIQDVVNIWEVVGVSDVQVLSFFFSFNVVVVVDVEVNWVEFESEMKCCQCFIMMFLIERWFFFVLVDVFIIFLLYL